jgi:hypothetical protein
VSAIPRPSYPCQRKILDMKQVFVLGAGFTRAFVPTAPLLVDDYGVKALRKKFVRFKPCLPILENERQGSKRELLNIERLMSRLDSLMPYDSADAEVFGLLLTSVKAILTERITTALQGLSINPVLIAFAKWFVRNDATCITFNYDDLLERALTRDIQDATMSPDSGVRFWHPNGGYGFFCRPASMIMGAGKSQMLSNAGFLLKLHGSTNWRIPVGTRTPYGIDSVYHFEDWLASPKLSARRDTVERLLETTPFIIPPVLNKTGLREEPIMRVVWSLAKNALSMAEAVTFLGYSLPETDLAARFLFSETLRRRNVEIRVVNKAGDAAHQEQVMSPYRSILPGIEDTKFCWDGAKPWIEGFVKAMGPR